MFTHECISFRKSQSSRVAQSGSMRNRCVMVHPPPDHLWFAHDSTLLNKRELTVGSRTNSQLRIYFLPPHISPPCSLPWQNLTIQRSLNELQKAFSVLQSVFFQRQVLALIFRLRFCEKFKQNTNFSSQLERWIFVYTLKPPGCEVFSLIFLVEGRHYSHSEIFVRCHWSFT